MPSNENSSRTSRESAPKAEQLGALRAEIDRLDDALLDLIEQRLAASHAVARQKQASDDGRLKLRPRREAAIVDRLSARARIASRELVNHVWRELMSFSLQAQSRTELVLCAASGADRLKEQVRDRFGWAAPVRWVATPAEALAAARASEAVAVVAEHPASGWWATLVGEPELVIFEALWEEDGGLGALMIGRIGADDLPESPVVSVMGEQDIAAGRAGGARIRVLAEAGLLRLCITGDKVTERGILSASREAVRGSDQELAR